LDHYVSRAGTNPRADAIIDGKDDEEEWKNNRHLAAGGAVEVLWIWLPDETRPGIGALHRAFRTPIGGAGTLLDPKNYDTLEHLRENVRPQLLIQDVIHFNILYWTQYTTTWEWTAAEPSVTKRPETVSEARMGRKPCGPSDTWDSTRGVFDGKTFRLAKGPTSVGFTADDIWPRWVRVEFALKEEETRLARGLSSGEREFTVEAVDFAVGRGELFSKPMKVGAEWIVLNGRDPQARDRFLVESRAVYGTSELVHGEGTPVYFGRVIDATLTIPAFRDDNN
jgi:hypothetical protein